MISETGSIVELKGKHVAVVLCQKSSFCSHCASMESCQVGDDNRSMLVEAHNAIGAQVGDKVRVVTSSKSFLQSSFLLYIVPLIALIVGGIIGQLLGERMELGIDPNLLSAIFGSAFLVGAFLAHPRRHPGSAAGELHAADHRNPPRRRDLCRGSAKWALKSSPPTRRPTTSISSTRSTRRAWS